MCLKSRLILVSIMLLILAGCFSSPRNAMERAMPTEAECDLAASDPDFDKTDLDCVQLSDVCGLPGGPPCTP